jgi:Arc/MetJ-type ribon-helix-helix transcriptional regulator
MKSVQVELPDKLADELNLLVLSGWFRNEEEVVRTALLDFLRHHRAELLERFQREDIAWALSQKETQYIQPVSPCRGSPAALPPDARKVCDLP